MEITQADVDGLAEKLGDLELTAGELTLLDVVTAAAAALEPDVEGFLYEEVSIKPGRLRSDGELVQVVRARLERVKGFHIHINPR